MDIEKYKQMVKTGDQYCFTIVFLQKRMNESEAKDDYEFTVNTLFPRIVIAGIACEIYLKALIYLKEGKFPDKTHHLEELFKKIEDSDKQWCEQEFNKWIKEKSDFYTELKNFDYDFVDWRYPYEFGWDDGSGTTSNKPIKSRVRPGSTTKFMKLLRELCIKYMPN